MGKQFLPQVAIFEVCYWEYIVTLIHSYAEVSLNLPKMWMLCTHLHLWHYEGEEDSQLGLILLYKTILSLKLLLALPVRERLQNHVVFIWSHMLRNFHQVLKVCNCDEWWVQFFEEFHGRFPILIVVAGLNLPSGAELTMPWAACLQYFEYNFVAI